MKLESKKEIKHYKISYSHDFEISKSDLSFKSLIFINTLEGIAIAYIDHNLNIIIQNIITGKIKKIIKTSNELKPFSFNTHISKDKKTICFGDEYSFLWFDLEWERSIVTFRKPRENTLFLGQYIGKVNKICIDREKMTCLIANSYNINEETDEMQRIIYHFDFKKGILLKKFTGYKEEVIDICLDQNSETFISIHKNGEIHKWNIETGKLICDFSNNSGKNILDLEFKSNYSLRMIEISKDNKHLFVKNSDNKLYFWDYQTGKLLVIIYALDHGYLWTTPPDEFAPNGWLHTNRPDLVSLIEMNKADQANPAFIPEDDHRFQEYMQMYNDQDMVMTRLNNFDRYQELLEIRLGNQKRTSEMLLKEHNPIKLLIEATPIQNDKVDGYE